MPQPNAKPLKYENVVDVKDTFDVFLKTEPSEVKYKSSQAPLRKREENHLSDVKSANDVFSWDMYKQPAGYVAPKPKSSSFLSRLDDTVKTIDFNNMTANRSGESSPLVTIHKRALSSPEDSNQTFASTSAFVNSFTNPKRKKYVVVPNSASTYPLNQSSQEPSAQPKSITEMQEMPTDRKELLKFVSAVNIFLITSTLTICFTSEQIKSTLSGEQYKAFLKTFMSYNNEADYETFRDGVFKIFSGKLWHFILKGLERFVKPAHKQSYQKDVNQFILNHS